MFFRNLDPQNSRHVNRKGLSFPRKVLVCGWKKIYLEVNEM